VPRKEHQALCLTAARHRIARPPARIGSFDPHPAPAWKRPVSERPTARPAAHKLSAGLLLWRRVRDGVEVFLVHPGGPFYRMKDTGVWSLPKGEVCDGEDPLAVARREFCEETGRTLEQCGAAGEPEPLGKVRLRSGKTVLGWSLEGDWPDGEPVRSNTFPLEWPPRSGRVKHYPEVDEGAFFPLPVARVKINPAMEPFLDRLVAQLDTSPSPDGP
jgi:predicted NUDIX family NTP pyrophosphohydrolase